MLGGGQTGWIKFAALLGPLAAVVLIGIYLSTKEQSDGDEETSQENVPFVTAIKALLHNKYWFILLISYFIGVIVQVCTLTVGVYYAKYVLNDIDMQANLTLYFWFQIFLLCCFCPPAIKRVYLRKNYVS